MKTPQGILLSFFLPVAVFAQEKAQETAPTLMSDAMARAALTAWIIGVLFVVLLGSAVVIINFAFAAKRPQDYVGRHTPSDQGVFGPQLYPEEPYEGWALPAEDDVEELERDKNREERKRRLRRTG